MNQNILKPQKSPPMPGIVADAALENDNGLVDFAGMIEDNSPDGIPGEELFLDHVHPSIEGNRMMVLAIVDEMIKMGTATPASTWDDAVITKITERVKSNVDEAANAMALTNLSRVLTWAGKQEEALRVVDSAMSITSDHHTLFQKVTVLLREGRYEEALPYSSQAASLMPEIATVRRDHGILLALLGHNTQARIELETAAQLNPTMPGLYYHLGLVLSDLGHTDQAMRTYQKAIELEPEHANACNNLGMLLTRRGDHEKALLYSAKAAQLMPEIATFRRTHGMILANLGRNTEALQELKTAARLDPKMIGLYYRLGLVLSELGYKDEAERNYRKALELEPENANACNNLGILLAQRGDLEAAMVLFERAVEANPEHRNALNNLERVRSMLGR